MKKLFVAVSLVALGLCIAFTGSAYAACPTNPTVTVPYPAGAADVVIYSSPACVALLGTDLKVQATGPSGAVLGATSVPSVTADASGLHVAANGAPFGAAYPLYITHLPSGKFVSMTANVGQATVAITASTATP